MDLRLLLRMIISGIILIMPLSWEFKIGFGQEDEPFTIDVYLPEGQQRTLAGIEPNSRVVIQNDQN